MNISDKEYEEYIRFYLDSMLNVKNTEKKNKLRSAQKKKLISSYIQDFSGNSDYLFSTPLYASLRLTSACNFRCVHCMYSGTDYSPKNDLSTEQVLNLADELINAGVIFVNLTGGEIFMRPDIMDIVRKFKQNNIAMILITNGSLLTDENINEIAELFNPYTDVVQISLDAACDETLKKIRRTDKFYKINENIKKLTDKGVVVDNVCVVNNINKNEISDIYKLATELGTNCLTVGKIKSYNDSHVNLECSTRELFKIYYELIKNETNNDLDLAVGFWSQIELLNIPEVKKIIEEPHYQKLFKKQYKNVLFADCQSHNKVAINNDGNIGLCIESFSYDIEPLGNYKDNSFEEIWERRWNNVLYQPRVREKTQCNECKYNVYCKGGCKVVAYNLTKDTNLPEIPNCQACH